jgi:hypothetical protein
VTGCCCGDKKEEERNGRHVTRMRERNINMMRGKMKDDRKKKINKEVK